MQVIGFNFTKISAERIKDKITAKPGTSIEFTDLEKEKVEILKDSEAIKITFKYSVDYDDSEKKDNPEGTVLFEGKIILSVLKDETKDIIKAWKKKKLPQDLNIFLFNLILRRCTPKSIFFEDEIGLPIHTPMPKLSPTQEGSN